MKKLSLILGMLFSISSYSQNYQLVWSDEFNGSSIDLSKWAFQNGNGCPNMCGWGNGELQSYTSDAKNVSVSNGVLSIKAIKENVGGSSFTSTKLLTNGLHSWKYGRFEASMKMPLGRGLWPAFWMLPTTNQWPTTGEIDIMEYRGDLPKQTNGTLHYGQAWPNNLWDGSHHIHSQNLSDDFHLYAVEWDEHQIQWFFDDVLMKTETKTPNSLNPASNSTNAWPWNTDFYIILNLAVGGGYTGSPTVDQVELTKATFEVDYVRVYSEVAAAPITIAGKIEAEDYADMFGVGKENTNDIGAGENLGWIDANDWMEYDINVTRTTNFDFNFRSASETAGGSIAIEVDGNEVVSSVQLPVTGTWQTWKSTVSKNIPLSKGTHKLKIKVLTGGFNLNYIEVTENTTQQNFLHAEGINIVNDNGNFQFKAINIGNYMVQEGYMLNLGGGYQHEIKQKIADVVGNSNMENFYTQYRKNYLTKADIDSIASWGFNSIRLPLHYNLLTELGKPTVFYESGFAQIDQVISWCKANNLYVILDLHAAPGGQSSGDICDYIAGQSSLWEDVSGSNFTSAQNRTQTIALWKKLAERYANEPTVGAYDLINETNWTLANNNLLLANLMKDITAAIRSVDQNHLLFIEGNSYANDYNGLAPKWDNNMAYSFHKYWNDVTDQSLNFIFQMRDWQQVPIFMGEFGENSNHWIAETVELMNKYNIGWAIWPHKKMGSISGAIAFKEPKNWSVLADYIKGGVKPTAQVGQAILDELLENVKLENCSINYGYLHALLPNSIATLQERKPIAIPGKMYAKDYNDGKNGVAYSDKVFRTTQFGALGGDYTAWNSGWYYRNDGVDIQYSAEENDAIVGWIETDEWMNYTVNTTSAKNYELKARVAGFGGKVSIYLDGNLVLDQASLSSTGGWTIWQTQILGNLEMPAGEHQIQLKVNEAGFNLNYLDFVDPLFTGLTSKIKEEINIFPTVFENQTQINISSAENTFVELKALNLEGKEVFYSNEISTNQTFDFGSELSSGMYILYMIKDDKISFSKVIKR